MPLNTRKLCEDYGNWNINFLITIYNCKKNTDNYDTVSSFLLLVKIHIIINNKQLRLLKQQIYVFIYLLSS